VAKQVGIFKEGDKTLDGATFRSLSEDKLAGLVDAVTVYARVDPLDKVKIVSLFHAEKKLVAMTGDGVNDVPSIMASDLGIAMGGIGTEVAKEAADLVLLNDSFESIIKAIEQGRHIFYTLRRVVLYFFVTNVGEIFMILFSLFAQLPLPITAAQILWLNLITDGFLDMALSMEPKEASILLQPGWLERKKRLIDTKLLTSVVVLAVPMGLMAMGVFMLYYRQDIKLARTMTLVTMAMAQWFNAWNCRSETRSLFSLSFFSNHWLLIATSFVLFLQLALIYVPFMQTIFATVPLSLAQWGLVVCLSAPMIVIDEIRKWFVRRAERRLV
jgi:Ca2+-transporting ATPase